MPYVLSQQTCKKCGEQDKLFRNKWSKANQKFYLQKVCKECEAKTTKQHQEDNREYWRKLNNEYYARVSEGQVSRRNVLNRSEEEKAQRARDKSNTRCTRAKQARFDDELTEFVTKEAHDLRKMRNKTTGIEWHVDHILPLKGKTVCGLHIWSNLQVIPKTTNLRKGAKIAIPT
jgi:hypothetical protein